MLEMSLVFLTVAVNAILIGFVSGQFSYGNGFQASGFAGAQASAGVNNFPNAGNQGSPHNFNQNRGFGNPAGNPQSNNQGASASAFANSGARVPDGNFPSPSNPFNSGGIPQRPRQNAYNNPSNSQSSSAHPDGGPQAYNQGMLANANAPRGNFPLNSAPPSPLNPAGNPQPNNQGASASAFANSGARVPDGNFPSPSHPFNSGGIPQRPRQNAYNNPPNSQSSPALPDRGPQAHNQGMLANANAPRGNFPLNSALPGPLNPAGIPHQSADSGYNNAPNFRGSPFNRQNPQSYQPAPSNLGSNRNSPYFPNQPATVHRPFRPHVSNPFPGSNFNRPRPNAFSPPATNAPQQPNLPPKLLAALTAIFEKPPNNNTKDITPASNKQKAFLDSSLMNDPANGNPNLNRNNPLLESPNPNIGRHPDSPLVNDPANVNHNLNRNHPFLGSPNPNMGIQSDSPLMNGPANVNIDQGGNNPLLINTNPSIGSPPDSVLTNVPTTANRDSNRDIPVLNENPKMSGDQEKVQTEDAEKSQEDNALSSSASPDSVFSESSDLLLDTDVPAEGDLPDGFFVDMLSGLDLTVDKSTTNRAVAHPTVSKATNGATAKHRKNKRPSSNRRSRKHRLPTKILEKTLEEYIRKTTENALLESGTEFPLFNEASLTTVSSNTDSSIEKDITISKFTVAESSDNNKNISDIETAPVEQSQTAAEEDVIKSNDSFDVIDSSIEKSATVSDTSVTNSQLAISASPKPRRKPKRKRRKNGRKHKTHANASEESQTAFVTQTESGVTVVTEKTAEQSTNNEQDSESFADDITTIKHYSAVTEDSFTTNLYIMNIVSMTNSITESLNNKDVDESSEKETLTDSVTDEITTIVVSNDKTNSDSKDSFKENTEKDIDVTIHSTLVNAEKIFIGDEAKEITEKTLTEISTEKDGVVTADSTSVNYEEIFIVDEAKEITENNLIEVSTEKDIVVTADSTSVNTEEMFIVDEAKEITEQNPMELSTEKEIVVTADSTSVNSAEIPNGDEITDITSRISTEEETEDVVDTDSTPANSQETLISEGTREMATQNPTKEEIRKDITTSDSTSVNSEGIREYNGETTQIAKPVTEPDSLVTDSSTNLRENPNTEVTTEFKSNNSGVTSAQHLITNEGSQTFPVTQTVSSVSKVPEITESPINTEATNDGATTIEVNSVKSTVSVSETSEEQVTATESGKKYSLDEIKSVIKFMLQDPSLKPYLDMLCSSHKESEFMDIFSLDAMSKDKTPSISQTDTQVQTNVINTTPLITTELRDDSFTKISKQDKTVTQAYSDTERDSIKKQTSENSLDSLTKSTDIPTTSSITKVFSESASEKPTTSDISKKTEDISETTSIAVTETTIGVTVTTEESPETCKEDEEWWDCKPLYHNTCENFARAAARLDFTCTPGCFCQDGLIKTKDGECVDPEDCPEPVCDDKNEEATDCVNQCNTCESNCGLCSLLMCEPGCECFDGYRRNASGVCVHALDCPPCPTPGPSSFSAGTTTTTNPISIDTTEAPISIDTTEAPIPIDATEATILIDSTGAPISVATVEVSSSVEASPVPSSVQASPVPSSVEASPVP